MEHSPEDDSAYGPEYKAGYQAGLIEALTRDLMARHEQVASQRAAVERSIDNIHNYLLSQMESPGKGPYFTVVLPPDEPHYIVHVDCLADSQSYEEPADGIFVANWVRYDDDLGAIFVDLGDGQHESYVVVNSQDFRIEPLPEHPGTPEDQDLD